MIFALAFILTLSLTFNAYLYLIIRKLNAQPPKRVLTVEAQQVLHDLTRGAAIVKITPVNPEEIFLRSPK